MDPIAHTLVGATLAETGLRRATPLATATLVIGANAPDVDAITMLLGDSDATLYWRRGWTHGVLAMVVLPVLIAGAMLLFDRLARRRRFPDAEPARAGPILALALLSVLTHPALDWLNNYGVRLLMPFDGTWFYGDAIFIVDPWMWLSMAAPVVLARTSGKLSLAAWTVLGCGATALVLGIGDVPWPAKAAWLAGVAAIVALRVRRVAPRAIRTVAVVCVSLLLAYVGAMVVGSRVTRREARAWLALQGIETDRIMAGPVAADPFTRDVVARSGDTYYFLRASLFDEPAFRSSDDPITSAPRTPAVDRALGEVPGLAGWMRFPAFEVGDGTVVIRDVRYARDRDGGFGRATIPVD